jgi:hypothetical protein
MSRLQNSQKPVFQQCRLHCERINTLGPYIYRSSDGAALGAQTHSHSKQIFRILTVEIRPCSRGAPETRYYFARAKVGSRRAVLCFVVEWSFKIITTLSAKIRDALLRNVDQSGSALEGVLDNAILLIRSGVAFTKRFSRRIIWAVITGQNDNFMQAF